MAKFGCRMFFNSNILCVHILILQVMLYGKIIELPTILTYSDGKKLSFTYDELDSKQKNINLRSCPATNFLLARDRYSYAVMEMQPHSQAAK